MKKWYLILALLGWNSYQLIASKEQKKILILTSSAWGNFAASQSVRTYLEAEYNIKLCTVFKEVLAPLDPFRFLTGNHYCGEDFYGWFVPGKHFQILKWLYELGNWYMQWRKNYIHILLRDYFIKTKPDLIISVIPVINNIILDVAQELNIPFILMPTDLDITPYLRGIINPVYKHFYVGLIFDDPEIRRILQKTHIQPKYIHILGAPLRKEFFHSKNKIILKKQYGIKDNKPVIMLLMGSVGSQEIKDYTEELLKIKEPFHLFICIGKHEQSLADLSSLQVPHHISVTIVGFTKDIANYMAISDVLITKSGTLSVCEALYMNLPLSLDATSAVLPWEEFNHTFIQKHGFGFSINTYQEIVPIITDLLKNKNKREEYQNNNKKLDKKICSHELLKLIHTILDKN